MRSLSWVILLSLGACQPAAPPSAPAGMSPESIQLDTTVVAQAFARLSRDTTVVLRNTRILSLSGQVQGREVQWLRLEPDKPPQLLSRYRSGTFPKLPILKASSALPRKPQALLHSLWPQPLPFVQARYRTLYHYTPLKDTLIEGYRLSRVGVMPIDTQHSQALWQGVLYLTSTQQVVGADLSRSLRTLWGQEHQYIGLRLLPDRKGSWRLASEYLALEIDPPGLSAYRLCLSTTYTYPPSQAERRDIIRAPCPFEQQLR